MKAHDSMGLPQTYIQTHHDHESDDATPCRQLSVATVHINQVNETYDIKKKLNEVWYELISNSLIALKLDFPKNHVLEILHR